MTKVQFKSIPFNIGTWTIVRLPKSASEKLPSRGMVMVEGTINAFHFQTPLEPDGNGSHWFRLTDSMLKAAKVSVDEILPIEVSPVKKWPEPKVPDDLKISLGVAHQTRTQWKDITPMARWDWIRWIGSTKNPETRQKRIEVALSKLKAGNRRPCCFNRTMCTTPEVSKNGVLLTPE